MSARRAADAPDVGQNASTGEGDVDGRGHAAVAGGLTIAAMFATGSATTLEPTQFIAPVGIAMGASLGPDIDHRGSLISIGLPATVGTYSLVFLGVTWLGRNVPALAVFDLWKLGPIWTRTALYLLGVSVVLTLTSWLVGRHTRHRGAMHSLLMALVACAVAFGVILALQQSPWLLAAFAWGWFSHLLFDAMTKMGLPNLLWPFKKAQEASA